MQDSSLNLTVISVTVICLTWLQLTYLITNEYASLLTLKFFSESTSHHSVAMLLLLRQQGAHCLGFWHGILFASFWSGEATWVIGSPEPYSCRKVGRFSAFHLATVWYQMSHGLWLTNVRLLYRMPETFQNHSEQAVINCHLLFPPDHRLSVSLLDFNLQKGYQQQHHCISSVQQLPILKNRQPKPWAQTQQIMLAYYTRIH